MKKSRILLEAALGAVAALLLFLPTDGHPPKAWGIGASLLVLQQLVFFIARARSSQALLALRRRPNVLWCVLLVVATIAVGAWIAHTQPVWGRRPTAEHVGLLAAIVWIVALPFTVAREQRVRAPLSRAGKVLLVATTSIGTLFAIEFALRVFLVQSDGFAVTAMHRAWIDVHWKPINSLRYRDREPAAVPGTKRVLVVGDSFAAGHGIADLDDTFARVLERGLGAGWRVHIAAQPGWSTDAEYAALVKYPLRPDVIVLSYYINDMTYLRPKEDGAAPPPKLIGWLVDDFFSTSYVYWHALHGGLGAIHDRYASDQLAIYDDPAAWPRHAADLSRFVQLAREQDVKLVVLVWPRLDGVESSRRATSKVSALFRSQGVDVIDLTDELAAWKAQDLVVNRLDAHPNERVHALVAKRLLEHIAPR